jgi:hypothetical protein
MDDVPGLAFVTPISDFDRADARVPRPKFASLL